MADASEATLFAALAIALGGCTIPLGQDFGGDRRPVRPLNTGGYGAQSMPRAPLRIEREFSWDLGERRAIRAAAVRPVAALPATAAPAKGERLQQEEGGDFWAQ